MGPLEPVLFGTFAPLGPVLFGAEVNLLKIPNSQKRKKEAILMRVIVAAAGTAGHINPALSIANKIKQEQKDSEIIFIRNNKRSRK
mgnify:CR=1 FL=1